jgi:hypothetical protein
MISFADAVNGWLQEKWPSLYFDNHRIFQHRNHGHVLCIFSNGETCLGESETIVSAQNPKFFDELHALIVRHIDSEKPR